MTEIVQKRLELMAQELEEMRRTKLFTSEETRIIIKKRKEFEHKIHAITKDLKSFMDYISYERCLLRDIQLRRDKFRIGEKKASIEHKIIKRIKLLYEVALQRFSNDVSLFLSFLKFCKKVNYINAASDAVSNMIKLHPGDPQIWQVAASWHAYDRKDINTAMVMLLKAVAIHKNSQLLYKEMVQIELYNTSENIQPEERTVQQEMCLKRLEEIINTVFENVRDCNFSIELMELVEKYSFANKIGDIIVERLLKDYSDNENVWHALAQRERRGLYYGSADSNRSMEVEGNSESTSNMRTPKARLQACFTKYEQGLNVVSSATKPKLWSLYLDFLLDLQQDTFGGATVLKTETLKTALNDVSAEGYLSEKHYMAWLELVNDKEALEIAEKGTNAIPHSLELWKARLRLQIIKNEASEVDRVFKLGIKALKENALPLWSAILRYHYLTSNDDYIELIYKDGVRQSKEISEALKPKYVEWLVLSRGIDAAREVYMQLAVDKPYCKEMHAMMSKLESLQIDYNFETWGRVHKLACEQFGKEDVDVWINYIQFYLHFNKGIPNLNECVQRICKQAEDLLPKSLVFDFFTKYKKITESA